jgi:hypothetical protein
MLFSTRAGLLALVLASLCPTLLAHGRLVTTDLPVALCILLTLLAFARLWQGMTAWRLLAAVAALSAGCLVKFSFPLVFPAVLAMAVVTIYRTEPVRLSLFGAAHSVSLVRRWQRVIAVITVGMVCGLAVWASIWLCYAGRYSAFRVADPQATMMPAYQPDEPPPTTMAGAWDVVFIDYDGTPMTGSFPRALQWARVHRLLPEAYVYGLAFTYKTAQERRAYLAGRFSETGWRSYFPIAFVIKTPIATILLFITGILAIICKRRNLIRDPVLLAGLVAFIVTYATFSISARLNIGHRHLLPLYPIVLILAGAATAWFHLRPVRWVMGTALLWLLAANLHIYPHYLSYFNELIGGPGNGHRYLVDSNIDWGQDLKRLAHYARAHPNEAVKLAYFGAADPTRYGFDCQMLPSTYRFGRPAELTSGTYVTSVTQLVGVYNEIVRDSFWSRPEMLVMYRNMQSSLAAPARADESEAVRQKRSLVADYYDILRRARLLNQLAHRRPDERIGYSLFVYRLADDDVEQMLAAN